MESGILIEILVVGIFSIMSAIAGAIAARWLTLRRVRVSVTMEIFRSFYTPDMHEARIHAAKYFLDHKEESITLNTLWDGEGTVPIYRALTRIVYFFFEIYQLEHAGMLNRSLAKRLFQWPFGYWKPFLEKLCKNTLDEKSQDKEGSQDKYDWLKMIDDKKLDWLLE